jgi:hypothetical protein
MSGARNGALAAFSSFAGSSTPFSLQAPHKHITQSLPPITSHYHKPPRTQATMVWRAQGRLQNGIQLGRVWTGVNQSSV